MMYRSTLAKLLALAVVLGSAMGAMASCDGASPVETKEAGPSPTIEVFTSSLLPTATAPVLIVEPGFGGARGVLATFPSDWAGEELFVYFAPFTSAENEEDGGIYILEPSVHPVAEVNPGGYFQLGNIPPGKYVLVIGPGPEEALAVLEGGRHRILEIVEGEILEVGQVHLER
jgi:hypothetical protein